MIQRVQDKLQLLVKQYQLLLKENERLKQAMENLKTYSETRDKQVEELELKLTTLKTATGRLNDADKKELEKRLNHYLREIDRCIALLGE